MDLVALVSYDQVVNTDLNEWSLAYLTIVGPWIVKGSRHDVATMMDLAVVDPRTRSLVIRAGGTDLRHGNTTAVGAELAQVDSRRMGFSAATDQMIEHFDTALVQFEEDVKSGRSNVQVIRQSGGGGAFDWVSITVLLGLWGWSRSRSVSGPFSQ